MPCRGIAPRAARDRGAAVERSISAPRTKEDVSSSIGEGPCAEMAFNARVAKAASDPAELPLSRSGKRARQVMRLEGALPAVMSWTAGPTSLAPDRPFPVSGRAWQFTAC